MKNIPMNIQMNIQKMQKTNTKRSILKTKNMKRMTQMNTKNKKIQKKCNNN